MAVKVDQAERMNDLAEFVNAVAGQIEEGSHIDLSVGDFHHALSSDFASALLRLLQVLASGSTVEIEELPRLLTTGQAADLLGISRPTVASLVDNGEIPATLVGTHRRIELVAVLAYRERRRSERNAAFGEMVASSQELGQYK